MKGGSILRWRTMVGVVRSTSPGAALRPSASFGLWESRAEWPCSVGIRSERVEAVGAAGRTTWTAVVGLADETSARGSSAGYPSFARLGASRPPQRVQVETTLPQGGGAAPNGCVAERRSEKSWSVSTLERKSQGGQNYSGARLRRR